MYVVFGGLDDVINVLVLALSGEIKLNLSTG